MYIFYEYIYMCICFAMNIYVLYMYTYTNAYFLYLATSVYLYLRKLLLHIYIITSNISCMYACLHVIYQRMHIHRGNCNNHNSYLELQLAVACQHHVTERERAKMLLTEFIDRNSEYAYCALLAYIIEKRLVWHFKMICRCVEKLEHYLVQENIKFNTAGCRF